MNDFAMLPPFPPCLQGVLLRQVDPFVPRRCGECKQRNGFRFPEVCASVRLRGCASVGRAIPERAGSRLSASLRPGRQRRGFPNSHGRTDAPTHRLPTSTFRAWRNQDIRVSNRRLSAMAGNHLGLRVTWRAQMSSVSASGLGLCRLRDLNSE
jgi:hypothetical protein